MANVIEANEVTFLCGEETLRRWKAAMNFAKRKMGFEANEKEIQLTKINHLLVKLELVGTWKEEDTLFMVEKEEDIMTFKAVKKIHKNLNHKSKEQMLYAFRSAGKLDESTQRLINRVTEECTVCKSARRSRPKPSVAISQAGDFNSTV